MTLPKLPALSRRFFLKLSALATGALAWPTGLRSLDDAPPQTKGGTALHPPAESHHLDDVLPVIPYPVEAAMTTADFELDGRTAIIISSADLRPLAEELQRTLSTSTGFELPISARPGPGRDSAIVLRRLTPIDPALGDEGYRLTVTPAEVKVEANSVAGLFYGMQTILQLMPAAIESRHQTQRAWTIKGARVVDRPRFAWRGLMLDVARRFFDKEFVKGYIDQMAKYKLNVLHLHLSDNEGWRVEVKKLPRLTTVGAWRKIGASNAEPFELADHARVGGFYTQDDIREIVAYASERHIIIMPEIDVPGHSYALTAAYPDLSCTQAPSGEVCPGNERVYDVLDQVLEEIAPLFPGEYFHVGGDEVAKDEWRRCPKCQALMRAEKLKDVDELQSYFIRRMEHIVRAHGKRLVGWDEILEGGLARDAVVMAWRGNGTQAARDAAQQAHPVVMTPSTHCYLDYAQGDLALEPRQNLTLLLSTCYRFEPVPDGVDSNLILGGQGNLWTGRDDHPRHAQYMTWPRAMALAEVFWSSRERRPWEDFVSRMEEHMPRLDSRGVKYARSVYQPLADLRRVDGERRIVLGTEVAGTDLHYTFDVSIPDQEYPRYTEALTVPPGATQLRVAAYRNGERICDIMDLDLAELRGRTEGLKRWRTTFELYDFWNPPPE